MVVNVKHLCWLVSYQYIVVQHQTLISEAILYTSESDILCHILLVWVSDIMRGGQFSVILYANIGWRESPLAAWRFFVLFLWQWRFNRREANLGLSALTKYRNGPNFNHSFNVHLNTRTVRSVCITFLSLSSCRRWYPRGERGIGLDESTERRDRLPMGRECCGA